MWNERLYAHLVCEMTTGKCISFCVFGAFLVACVVCDEMPNTFEEQQDPLFQQHFQQQQNLQQMLFPRGPYPAGYPNQFGHTFPQQLQGNSVNFDFQCKCTAKTPRNGASTTMPLPTDANAQAQQQIQQLQEQLRQQQDQMKRSQSQQPFEQFAHMLSVADGLDCSCSGSSMPPNDPVLGNNGLSPQPPHGIMPVPRVSGLPLTNPFQARLAPLSEFGPQLFP